MITVRPATMMDAQSMSDLLNAIVMQGGTTARTRQTTAADLAAMMQSAPGRSAWKVALTQDGTICGFQSIEPHPDLPPEACDIATFVQIGRTGLGIGSALFSASVEAAKALGYVWINANIRTDNEGGLIYYQSRGFRDYGLKTGIQLANGQTVDKVFKRYDI